MGGLRATFISDFIHTFLIFGILFAFLFAAFAADTTNGILGSPGKVWDLLQTAATVQPIAGNAEGTFRPSFGTRSPLQARTLRSARPMASCSASSSSFPV